VVTDPNEHTTTTTYTPATGYPTETRVTNHLGHLTRTQWLLARQAPAAQIDARGKTTTYSYDALGRVTGVWRPTEPATGPASFEFHYTIDAERDAPPVIRTRQLQSTSPSTVYLDSWVIYDSLLRERQTQRQSPSAGNVIVTDTAYDNRGLVSAASLPEALPGTPGTLRAPEAPDTWDNANGTSYDELGRPRLQVFRTEGTDRWNTATSYGHDTVTVTPNPIGGEVVTTLDAYGQTIGVAEWATRGDPASAQTTTYGYDLAGRLRTVADPVDSAANPARATISYSYDLAGWRTAMTDRDAGTWAYGYDLAGNQTSVTDALGDTTQTVYDELNRPTARHAGNPALPLAIWNYDAPSETGLLSGSIRFVRDPGEPERGYFVDIAGYDDRARPTGKTWVVFDEDLPGLGGNYTVGYGYDRADHITQVGYPQIGDPQNGGLDAETVTTSYNTLGLPQTMDGTLLPTGEDNQDYLYAAGYDDRARPLLFGFGRPGSGVGKTWTYDDDQRLARTEAAASGNPIQDRQITYEDSPAGNILERRNTINARTWQDCYRYDDRNRLTRAYTTSHTDACAESGAGGGDGPYDHTYTYSHDGNITQRVEDGDTITYTYPAPGQPRTHAPTRLDFPGGGDDLDYTWDANGQLIERRRGGGGTVDTFRWDEERRLTAIDSTGSATASFVYDADGNRLVRRNVDRNTAYFDGHEISINGGGQVTVVRTYTLDGQPIATRTAAHGVEYLITDNQGSIELAARDGESTPTVDRTYNPYGQRRTGNDPLTDRGWIGQIEDHRTNLSYFNNRYYDAALYRFISPDLLADSTRPGTFNPYQYGLHNPTTNGDPTGLDPRPWNAPNFDAAGFNYEAYAARDGFGPDISLIQGGQPRSGLSGATPPSASIPPASPTALEQSLSTYAAACYPGWLAPCYAAAHILAGGTLSEAREIYETPCDTGSGGIGCDIGGVYHDEVVDTLIAFVVTAGLSRGATAGGLLGSTADDAAGAALAGTLDDAAFAQTTFREAFSRGGLFAGQSIDDVARAIRSGDLAPSDVPIQYVVRDGNTLILNTRSAQALARAGVPRSDWSGINMTGVPAAEARLSAQLSRNGLDSTGTLNPRSTG
jgi:RHS repeat-associated protein